MLYAYNLFGMFYNLNLFRSVLDEVLLLLEIAAHSIFTAQKLKTGHTPLVSLQMHMHAYGISLFRHGNDGRP